MAGQPNVEQYNVIVVGKGMMGAAAARHLTGMTDGVALVGPDEPRDRAAHNDVFASHYDEGRIYRVLDPNPVWARLALRSIERYVTIEQESGIAFHEEAGFLAVGRPQDDIDSYGRTGEALGRPVERFDADGLAVRFPYLRFAAGSIGYFENTLAGYISPRRLVLAQEQAAARRGATIVREPVHTLTPREHGVEVTTASGRLLRAPKAIVATGGFANLHAVLPRPVALDPSGRVVVLLRVEGDTLARLQQMPSLVVDGASPLEHIYALPPVRYPDGRWYVKIGTGEFLHPLATLDAFVAWFQSAGPAEDRAALHETLLQLIPELDGAPLHTDTCVVTTTPSDYPYVDLIADGRICLALGGNGRAAKSSDEIGRLAASLLLAGEWNEPEYPRDAFRARFATAAL
jgi:sarcosine oxidase